MAISIGDALLKLGIDTKDLDKGMKGLSGRIQKHNKAIGLAMTAAGGAIVAMGISSVKKFAEMGDEVQKMALRTGFSTEALSELRHAAEISGASLTTLEKGVKRMSGTILDAQDGMETYIRAFTHLGIEVEELDGLNPEQQFLRIAEAIAEVEDPTKRAALAQDIFGRAGTELLPLFAAGKEGLADLREEAHKLGIVFDQEAANSAAELTDAMHKTKEAMSGLKMKIATALIPIIIPLVDKITNLITNMTDWMKAHPGLSKVITILGMGLGMLLLVLGPLLIILPSLTAALPLLGMAFTAMLGPVGLVIVAIAALIAIGVLVWKNWDTIKEKSKEIWGGIARFFTRIWEDITKIFSKHWDKVLAIIFPPIGIPILISREWNAIKEFLRRLNPWELIKAGWDKLTEGIKGVLKNIFGGSILEAWTQGVQSYLGSVDLAPAGEAMFGSFKEAAEKQLASITTAVTSATKDWATRMRVGAVPTGVAEELAYEAAVREFEAGRAQRVREAYERGAGLKELYALAALGYGYGIEALGAGPLTGGLSGLQAKYASLEKYKEAVKRYIPEFQYGGIAMHPMLASIAEKKPEAIIPLDKLGGMTGKQMMTIIYEVDGRQMAKTIMPYAVGEIRLRTGVHI